MVHPLPGRAAGAGSTRSLRRARKGVVSLPFDLPDWLPWWAPLVAILPLALFVLAFLLMPFGVFGVKGRLDQIEMRLDDIQAEIRTLALRLPEIRATAIVDEADFHPPRRDPGPGALPQHPPIPPRPAWPGRGTRTEPRLD